MFYGYENIIFYSLFAALFVIFILSIIKAIPKDTATAPVPQSWDSYKNTIDISLLPFWKTIGDAYALAWRYRREYFRISWLGLLAATLTTCLCSIVFWSQYRSHTAVCTVSYQLLAFMWVTPAAIQWQRFMLSDRKTSHADKQQTPYVNVSEQRTSYAQSAISNHTLIQYFIIAAIVLLLTEMVPLTLTVSAEAVTVLIFALVLCLLLALFNMPLLSAFIFGGTSFVVWNIDWYLIPFQFPRMAVLLSAKALDMRGVDIDTVFSRTRWNWWRLFGGLLLCIFPLIFASVFLVFPFVKIFVNALHLDHEAYVVAGSVVFAVFHIFNLVIIMSIYLTFLCLAYRHFFEGQKAST